MHDNLGDAAKALQLAHESRPAEPYKGMRVSVTGSLEHAARSLRAMAVPPESTDPEVLADHEDRIAENQPELRAFALEQLAKHLDMLKKAIDQNDQVTIQQFFNTYVLD